MRAVCWEGKGKVHVGNVPEPKVLNPRDAIIKVTSTAICGSDLHLYDGYIPTVKKGDIFGHEFMGEIVEVGPDVGGKLGALFAKLFGAAPEQEIQEDLRRFKQLTEAGEIPTTQGQTSCRH